MNLRVIVAVLYTVLFLLNLVNFVIVPPSLYAEVGSLMFSGLIVSLSGMLLAIWVYQDGESIKILHWEVRKLEGKLSTEKAKA